MAETSKGIPLMSLNDIADITQVNKSFNKINELLEEHENKKIASEEGVHGFRFNKENEEFESKNESGEWESIGGVGGATAVLSPIKNIKISTGNGKLTVSWEDPDDNTWGGTKLLYKIGSYPQNPKDGTLVVDNKVKNEYESKGIEINALTNGTKYYLMFFPYDNKNKYSFNVENRAIGTPQSYRVMTVKIDQNNSNPETCCTYHDDAENMTPGSDEWDEFFGHYPCLLQNGKEFARLQKDDFSKLKNGSDANITTGESGDVMICFPKMAWKIKSEGKIVTISLTDNPKPSEDFCFFSHENNNKIYNKVYLGAYLSSEKGETLSSLSNKKIAKGFDFNTIIEKIKQKGENYFINTFYFLTYIQILFTLKFKNLKLASIVGGLTLNDSESFSGITNKNGMNYFNSNFTNSDRCKVFGLEDLFGNAFECIANITAKNNKLEASKDGKIFKEVTEKIGETITNEQTNIVAGFFSEIYGSNETGFLGKIFSGSTETFFCSQNGYRNNNVARALGDSRSGVFSLFIHLLSDEKHKNQGARIMYFAEEVTE